jgi:hypothetical protein
MKSHFLSAVCVLTIAAPAWAVNISWLSFHPTDDATTQAAAQGYTMATDQGYIDLLRGAGHTVTRFQVQSPDAAFIDQIDNADLVIASRQVLSGDWQDPPELTFWHGISKPMMLMSGYIIRQNRLQFMAGDTIPDASAAGPVTLNATQPSHPIFQGVTLDAMNNMAFANYPVMTPSGLAMRGISVVTGNVAGGGSVLATLGGADASAGAMLIGHWQAGAVLGANTLAAPRMIFLSGTREPTTPADIQLAGVHDLTSQGNQLFLNAVCFMSTCGPPLVPGDTNGNGVGGEFPGDFDPIRNNFQKTVTSRAQGDLVTNGIVDFDDFREWKAVHLGMGGSLEGVDLSFANVPEPASVGLAIVAACGLGARARRRRLA